MRVREHLHLFFLFGGCILFSAVLSLLFAAPKQETLSVLLDGIPQQITVTDYLTGVLLAELPGSFHREAKIAQAIAAHTFALRRIAKGIHNGQVCGNPNCCQDYRSPESYLQEGGSESVVAEAKKAAAAASQWVLTYDGTLIEAVYFAASGGSTENAEDVWGHSLPYLTVRDSSFETADTTETKTFSHAELTQRLGLKENCIITVGDVSRTAGGGVREVQIADQSFSGLVLRQRLALRSTKMMLSSDGDTLTVTTQGYGHRVGMSQYGAEALARSGYRFREILAYYYPGTSLSPR